MRPVYVCQLEERKQMEVRRLLEGLILHGCGGDKSEVERYYGMSFEEAVQNGMDSKIVDLDYLMVFYAEEYNSGKADEEFRLADAAVISSILKEARKSDDVPPFVYPCGRTGWSCRRMSGNGKDGGVYESGFDWGAGSGRDCSGYCACICPWGAGVQGDQRPFGTVLSDI